MEITSRRRITLSSRESWKNRRIWQGGKWDSSHVKHHNKHQMVRFGHTIKWANSRVIHIAIPTHAQSISRDAQLFSICSHRNLTVLKPSEGARRWSLAVGLLSLFPVVSILKLSRRWCLAFVSGRGSLVVGLSPWVCFLSSLSSLLLSNCVGNGKFREYCLSLTIVNYLFVCYRTRMIFFWKGWNCNCS